MKLVRESLSEETHIPLASLSWNDIEEPDKKYINVPQDFMTSSSLYTEAGFNRWYKEFIEIWGTEGYLVKWKDNSYELKNNLMWDLAKEKRGAGVAKYYSDKKGGGYAGD